MSEKNEIKYKNNAIKVTEEVKYWKLKYEDGSHKKIYHHIDQDQNAVWMWESGTIDEDSLEIGKLIEKMSPDI